MFDQRRIPRLHKTITPFKWMPWLTLNVVPGWLPLVVSLFMASAPAPVVYQFVAKNIIETQQRDTNEMFRLIPIPSEFFSLLDSQGAMEAPDGLTFAMPSFGVLPVEQPAPEVVEVIREVEVRVQDPELLAELRALRNTNRLLADRNESMRDERDAALANARGHASDASYWEGIAGELAIENTRLTAGPVTPEPIGAFGYVGHRVFQSPPPGREVVGEPITLELVGEPELLRANWQILDCGYIPIGGDYGPVFRFRVLEASRCRVRITEPRAAGSEETFTWPIRGEFHVTIERVRRSIGR